MCAHEGGLCSRVACALTLVFIDSRGFDCSGDGARFLPTCRDQTALWWVQVSAAVMSHLHHVHHPAYFSNRLRGMLTCWPNRPSLSHSCSVFPTALACCTASTVAQEEGDQGGHVEGHQGGVHGGGHAGLAGGFEQQPRRPLPPTGRAATAATQAATYDQRAAAVASTLAAAGANFAGPIEDRGMHKARALAAAPVTGLGDGDDSDGDAAAEALPPALPKQRQVACMCVAAAEALIRSTWRI